METTGDKTNATSGDGNGATAPAAPAHHDRGHTDSHAHADVPKDLPQVNTLAVVIAGVLVVLAFVGLFLLGWIPRHNRLTELDRETAAAADARPIVEVAQPKKDSKPGDLVLPADVRATQETSIFPRANGYLKRFTVDIGDRVKEGQLLAEIETPDVDADLNQAKALFEQAKANLGKAESDFNLAATTLKRYEQYAQSGGLSQQELDEKRAAAKQAESALRAAQASVGVAQANVERLAALQGFEKVIAPFNGVITARNYDIGSLMSPSNTGAGHELFRLAATETLHVYVNVPQAYVTSVNSGLEAKLSVKNYGAREFSGKVARSTGALDPQTRTLRYELDFPNKEGLLFAGMYGEVRLPVSQSQQPMVVPTSAIVFDASGTRVWIVDEGKVSSRVVKVGRDLGTEVEITGGLEGTETVVTNPGDRLFQGASVQLASAAGGESKPQQASAR